jgi:hypothetical protein
MKASKLSESYWRIVMAKTPSKAQKRQRQLSWLLRITSGMHANLATALRNSDSLTNEEFREVNIARKNLVALEAHLRVML